MTSECRFSTRFFAGVAASVFLTGCATDFDIHRVDPLPAAESGFVKSKQSNVDQPYQDRLSPSLKATLVSGIRAQRSGRSSVAAGFYLRALEILAASDSGENCLEARKFATSRLIELCATTLLTNSREATLRFDVTSGASSQHYKVCLRRGAGPGGVEPANFIGLEPTDRYAVSGVPSFSARPGVGATLVGKLRLAAPFHVDAEPVRRIPGLCWSVTAVPAFGHVTKGIRPVTLELYEPHDTGTVSVARSARKLPLAADFTTPLVASTAFQRHRFVWLTAFLRGDEYFSNSGLYPTEEPSAYKTPLIFVHGLVSDPTTFQELGNALVGDPKVCQHYQIWVFFYPSSLPVPASANLLRHSLAGLVKTLDPTGTHSALHRMVLIGHSMGGLLTRLVVSDSNGDTFYHYYFRKPMADLRLTAEARNTMRQIFFFHADPNVQTAVFIATPHRGSRLALSLLGSIGKLVIGLPRKLHADLRAITGANRAALADPAIVGENSVFGLSPNSPLVKALAAIPLHSDRTRLYSIVGNRGRRGPLATSSDGVVPFASAHLPQAVSEVVVPASHTGIVKAPETIAEVVRILRIRAVSRENQPSD